MGGAGFRSNGPLVLGALLLLNITSRGGGGSKQKRNEDIQLTCPRWFRIAKTNNIYEPFFSYPNIRFVSHWTTADDSQRQPTIATGKTCMKWTIAAVLRSTCLLYLRKLFLLPEATAKVCKLPVAIVGCRWLSSAVACKLPVAIVRQS